MAGKELFALERRQHPAPLGRWVPASLSHTHKHARCLIFSVALSLSPARPVARSVTLSLCRHAPPRLDAGYPSLSLSLALSIAVFFSLCLCLCVSVSGSLSHSPFLCRLLAPSIALSLHLSPSLFLSLSLSFSLFLSLSLSRSLSPSRHAPLRLDARYLYLFLSIYLFLALGLTLSLSHALTHSLSVSLFLPLSSRHDPRGRRVTLSLTHTHSIYLSPSLSLTHTLCLSISLCLS